MMKQKLFLISIISLFGWLIFYGQPTAVEAATMQVTPINTYLTLSGGDTTFVPYQLINNSNQEVAVTISALSFQAGDLNGQPQLLDVLDFPYFSLYEATSASAAVTELIIPAQSGQNVFLKLEPPVGIAEREYPLTIFFNFVDPNSLTEDTQFQVQLGSNLIIAIGDPNLDLSQLSLTPTQSWPKVIDSFFAPSFVVQVENAGAYSTLITGEVTLSRPNGTVVKSWELYPDLILGYSTRLARGKAELDANGNPALITDFQLPFGLLGQYQLTVNLTSGHPAATEGITWQVNFFAIPYYLIFTLVLVVLIWLIWRAQRKRRQTLPNLTEKIDTMKTQKETFTQKVESLND